MQIKFFVKSDIKKIMGGIAELSPVYLAVVHYQRNEYDECIDICSKVLEKNPYDEAVWSLKTRALTAQVMINVINNVTLINCYNKISVICDKMM